MSDIFDEVLRDHSYEKKIHYFKRLLPFVAIFTTVVVIGMLSYDWYANKTKKHNMKIGDQFIEAISLVDSDKKRAIESLDKLIQNSKNKVREVAELEKVNVKLAEGDKESAIELLEKIINNKHYQEITTAYARILLVSLMIDKDPLSDQEKDTINRCLAYFYTPSQAFFGSANLLKAIWLIKSSDIDQAKDALKRVLLADLPLMQKEIAKALLSNLEQK